MQWMCLAARLGGLCLLAALPCAPAAAQQAPASTLHGTIQDQTGAVVPGATVPAIRTRYVTYGDGIAQEPSTDARSERQTA